MVKTITHVLAAVFLVTLTFIFACNSGKTAGNNTTDSTKNVQTTKADTAFKDNVYNETARYISGLPQPENNQFSALENNKRWQKYASEADTSWNKLYNDRLNKMQDFGKTELGSSSNKIQTLFYPFSGPDILNVYQFYPNAQQYVMFGLEPNGTFPDTSALKKDTTLKYITEIKASLQTMIATSFFKTKEMRVQLHSIDLDGQLPIIALFITRINGRIDSYDKVYVDNTGKLQVAGSEKEDSINVYGVRLTFTPANSSEVKTVIYFSTNISDNGFKSHPNFKTYLESLGTPTTYVKSASYLMFLPGFSIIRNIILDHSSVILEDDSGIPVKYLTDDTWNKTFYGMYTRPIELFHNDYQQELRDDYTQKKYTVKPLNFGIGYNFNLAETHLMLFQRKK